MTNGLNLFPYCPVIVNRDNGKFLIIDGQHRFTASMELGYPVYYVVAEDIPLRDIARMNSTTDKWKNQDFLACYIEIGIKDYESFEKFVTKYKVKYSVAVQLLMRGKISAGGGPDMEMFKDGKFECKHHESAIRFIEQVDRLFGRYVFYRDRNLLIAVQKLNEIGNWDTGTMHKKLGDHPNLMEKQSSAKTYMYLLDRIYNTRNRERRQIF